MQRCKKININQIELELCVISGVDAPTQYSCEAHNEKGLTVSREAHVNIKGKAISPRHTAKHK